MSVDSTAPVRALAAVGRGRSAETDELANSGCERDDTKHDARLRAAVVRRRHEEGHGRHDEEHGSVDVVHAAERIAAAESRYRVEARFASRTSGEQLPAV